MSDYLLSERNYFKDFEEMLQEAGRPQNIKSLMNHGFKYYFRTSKFYFNDIVKGGKCSKNEETNKLYCGYFYFDNGILSKRFIRQYRNKGIKEREEDYKRDTEELLNRVITYPSYNIYVDVFFNFELNKKYDPRTDKNYLLEFIKEYLITFFNDQYKKNTFTDTQKQLFKGYLHNFNEELKQADINNINMGFYLVSDTYKKEDWIFAIIIVQAIKYFLPELYWDEKYKGATSLLSGDSIENIILRGLKSKKNFLFIDKYVLWQVMYKIDIIDCKEIMTEREAILMKIESDNIQENDLKSCLKYANSENHFVKIIQFIGNNTEIKYESKREFIFEMCQCLMSPYNYVLSTEQWIKVSNKFIDVLKEIKLEKRERQQFLHNFNLIARKLFSKERNVYSVILYNFFSVKEVDTAFGNLSNDVGIGRWYALFMRFRNNGETQNIIQDIDMLDEIRNYFGMLHDEWKRDKEQVDLEDLFVEVDKVCELCKVWINLESSLYVENKEENLFLYHFIVLIKNAFHPSKI